ncbi:lectin-like domain-containing protein [Vagococcus lutrae]|uniref:lectin-like domain-containing protein n=1 Tax=Vagococcus lutrae TaxID=81947 RepID=UPI0023A9CE3D|nr:hypothetical protein [Vagococcus lutrae]WEB81246.1 hypothetical protein LVJ09_08665 [Vagococcus lutrae]
MKRKKWLSLFIASSMLLNASLPTAKVGIQWVQAQGVSSEWQKELADYNQGRHYASIEWLLQKVKEGTSEDSEIYLQAITLIEILKKPSQETARLFKNTDQALYEKWLTSVKEDHTSLYEQFVARIKTEVPKDVEDTEETDETKEISEESTKETVEETVDTKDPTTTDSSEEEREETAGVETSDQTEEADLRKETKPQETLSEEKSVEAVIESAPKGLRLYDLMQKANTNKNNARVKTNSANNTDVVIITDDKKDNGGQAGAIWSEEGYRIDLRRSFHLKMKVYLGNKGKDAADGITFTMHNDPRKGNAIGHDGQSLGAMGNFKNKKPWTKDSGVIENSFSIEFDTHLNNDGNNESDKYNFQGKNKPHPAYHMSMYYPNLMSSYTDMGFKGYSLIHERFSQPSKSKEKATPDNSKFLTLPESPADGAWHDFSLDYERVEVDTSMENIDFSNEIPLEQRSKYSYRLSYTFDGKTYEFYEKKTNEATTGLKNHHENSSLELNRLGVTRDPSDKPYEGETELTEDNPYVYWGLTGATGKQSSVQAVVFTELPDLGAPTVTQDVLKEDEGQDVSVNEINDTTIGPRPKLTVKSGDKLKYQYMIDFPEEGNQSIRNLEFDASFNDKIAQSVKTEDVKITYENQKPGPGEENVGQVLPVENLSYEDTTGKLHIENFQAIGPGDGYPTRVKIEVPFIVDQDFTLSEKTTLQDNVVIGGTYEDQSTSRQLLTNQVKYTVKPFDGEITGNAIEVESRDLIKEAIHLQKAQVLKDRTLIPPNELETLIIEKIKNDDEWQLGSIPKDEWVKDLIISGLDRVTYHPGEYGLRATYNKGPKPYTDFRLIVSDGALEIKFEGGLDYQPKISSQKKQSALSTKRATVTVTDQRFAQDSWQVEVKASPFKKNEEQEEQRLQLKIAEMILQEASYIWDDGNNKSTCLEIGKKQPSNVSLPVELYMEDASTWARVKDSYHATVSWNLSPKTSNLPRVTLPKAREEEAP